MWNIMRLTEHFGPMGIGWGNEEPRFNIVETNGELIVFCVMQCWYKDDADSERAYIWGFGGNFINENRSGVVYVDDDAYKKAYTDALMNAFVRIGTSADVHLGMFEDYKYLSEVREHFDNSRAIQAQIQGPTKLTTD